MSTWKNIKHKT